MSARERPSADPARDVGARDPARHAPRAWILPVALFAALGIALLIASRGQSRVEAGASAPAASAQPSVDEEDNAPPPASAWSSPEHALRRAASDGDARTDPLSGFHAALSALKNAKGATHVRVLFFGDSHTQGEYLPNAIREALQARFGDGGPGYLYAGDAAHRSEAATLGIEGAWQHTPKAPASPLAQDDGVFGLGGIRMSASVGVARVDVAPKVPGRMRADVCARSASGKGRVQIVVGDVAPTETRLDASVRHLLVDVPAPGSFRVDVSGDAALCGVVLERADEPGVVVDSLGIAGARFATALAWDEATFTAEVARRAPSLVVLEYGTNESAAGHLRPDAYAKDATDLVARVRRAAPNADCLLLGPTELEAHPDAVAVVSPAIEAAAEKAGCAFWDTWHAMGGPGSMHAWRTGDTQLAQSDGIHLTADGYKKLGALLAADLLAGLDPPPP